MAEEKSVQGVRRPLQLSLFDAFMIAVPVVSLGWPIWWFVKLVPDASFRFRDDPALTIILGVFFIGLFIFGISAARNLPKSFRRPAFDSECPCCGTRATREYRSDWPTRCGTCPAYLRADGDRIREERPDGAASYTVEPEQYLPTAKRNYENHFEFNVPEFCAVCGVPSSELRKINRMRGAVDLGLAGDVAKEVAFHSMKQPDRKRLGLWDRATPPKATEGDALDDALDELKVRVCHAHQSGFDPVSCANGTLSFESYRYYKEFLALNHIAVRQT